MNAGQCREEGKGRSSTVKPRDIVGAMIRAQRVGIRQVNEMELIYKKRDKKDQKENGRNRRHGKETHHMFV